MAVSKVIVVAALLTLQCASALKIGFVPFPEAGHMGPLIPIWYEALSRGHQVKIYGPEKVKDYVARRFKDEKAVTVETYGHNFGAQKYDEAWFEDKLVNSPILDGFSIIEEKMRTYFEELVPELMKVFAKAPKADRPDVLLIDHGSFIANAVADHYEIPVVMLWPLILQFPGQLNPAFPSIATGLSMNMSPMEKVFNYIFQRVAVANMYEKHMWTNKVRVANGIAPEQNFDELYTKYPTLTPSVFGLDMAQPLCPNVFPVGFLFPPLPTLDAGSEAQQKLKNLESWMENKCDHVVYFNLGSIAAPNPRISAAFEGAILKFTDASPRNCVVWKLSKRSQETLSTLGKTPRENVLLSTWFEFSPRHFISHPKVKVFVTHCGDTSVYEAVDATVPMVGVGMFADQPDMCARMVDAGIGLKHDKMTVTEEDLFTSITAVVATHGEKKEKLVKLKNVGHLMGGAKKAVDVLEMSQNKWFAPSLVCGNAQLPLYQKFDIDVIVATGFAGAAVFILLRTLCGCCCGKKVAKEKLKKD